jgi:alpha-1,2-mannosyltransferase
MSDPRSLGATLDPTAQCPTAPGDTGMRRRPRLLPYRAANATLAQVCVVLLTLGAAVLRFRSHAFAFDFDQAYWPAGHRVLQGESPYVDPAARAVLRDAAFVYPALAALVFAPFALLPHTVADVVFTALCVFSLVFGLHIVGVRDRRLLALLFLSFPVFIGWGTANVSMVLCLGLAALWRWRDHPLGAGVTVALIVSLKLFLWPLGLWLLATRRFAAFGYACLGALVANGVAWTILGWDQVQRYNDLVGALARHQEGRGYGLITLVLQHGADRATAYGLAFGIAAAVSVACIAIGRRGRDAPALALCVAASLLATPVLWPHYFVLLAVPLALARPKLSLIWAVPMAMWVGPPTDPVTWQILVALAVGATMVAGAVRLPHSRRQVPRAPASPLLRSAFDRSSP